MKLALCTDVLADLPFAAMLDKVKSYGIEGVEMTAGRMVTLSARENRGTSGLARKTGEVQARAG